MRAYVGQTRSRALVAELAGHGIGECTNRGEFPPRRTPWFLDNGAFSDWRNGRPFDGDAFVSDVLAAGAFSVPPDFAVVPDLVGRGLESLEFSLTWHRRIGGLLGGRWYLAVQDGMTHEDVLPFLPQFAGIFVGGTLGWKLRTGAGWVGIAHANGTPAHIGRVGTARRVAWARRIGADSIDSCLPLWSRDNLRVFLAALQPSNEQLELFCT